MTKFNPQPKKGMPEKKKPVALKRTRIKYKKVAASDNLYDFFKKIWINRSPGNLFLSPKHEFESMEIWLQWVQQYRVCCVTYKPLKEFDVWNFAHVLARQFKKFRTEDFNILLMSRECHTAYDTKSREEFLKLGPGAKFVLEYHDYLKGKYYKERNT